MNQQLYVKLPHVKNNLMYELHVPYGVQWKEVREVMLEMVVDLSKEIDAYERQEKERLEAEALAKAAAEKAAAEEPKEEAKVEEVPNPSSIADSDIIPD